MKTPKETVKAFFARLKFWYDYHFASVSMIVEDMCEYLKYAPQAFYLKEGPDGILIGLRDSRMWQHLPARVRLETTQITLDMGLSAPRVELNIREFAMLAQAVSDWLEQSK